MFVDPFLKLPTKMILYQDAVSFSAARELFIPVDLPFKKMMKHQLVDTDDGQ